MFIRTLISVIGFSIFIATIASAGNLPNLIRDDRIIHGGSTALSKVSVDTIDVMGPTGSGATYLGDFEAGWNGWTNVDVTQPTVTHWQVSTYNQAGGNLAAWCGDITIASCNDSLDAVGGYGNSWHDLLVYRATVANPGISASVTIVADLQYDTEPGYDYIRVSAKIEGNIGFTDLQSWDNSGVIVINQGITYLPGEYVDGTDVYILFRVQSDGGWSDEDCFWPTAGACQIDNVVVTTSQTGEADIVASDDFEDGTFGNWFADFPDGVGNFAALWRTLQDVDPCATNYSQQVAYIDDGVVVPGTGGSDCLNWCYGPSGYIVNTTGGLAGPQGHIQIKTMSPVMLWPNATYDGMVWAFDIYRHEDLDADSPGIFYQWAVRSADTDGSAGTVQVLSEEGWGDRAFVYYGGPDYLRAVNDVTDLMNAGRDEFQVRVGVYELGWAFGFAGNDGFPAPYFDNVSVKVYPFLGPGMSTRELDLAQDTFAEVDALPTAGGAVALAADLETMHVRFDMANNISLIAHLRNDPGDSIVVDIVPVRSGSVLTPPQMHYAVDANPVFNGVRGAFPTSGTVAGSPAIRNGTPSATRWAFDLPDTGFLYPGDVLHYYFRAGDDLMGDILYSTLPANTTGFGDFLSGPLAYNTTYTVHALPSVRATATPDVYTQPSMLFWNDNANRGAEAEWYSALNQLGYQAGDDYDIYYTNSPSSGVGNGIGGRSSGLALEDYSHMLYSSGALGASTISNGDFQWDAGDDISAVLNWLSDGNKSMYMTGDALAQDLGFNAGAAGLGFMETVMGLNLTTQDVRGFIDNQATPLVLAIAGNSVVVSIDSWIAYGGCFAINTFDGVTIRAGAERLAEFADTNDAAGTYPFAALTRNTHNTTNSIISQPFDFGYTHTDPNEAGGGALSGRVQLLDDILTHFGSFGTNAPSAALPTARFATSAYPNPFNPVTKISYTIKAAGHLTLKIYDVRGRLVRTLLDEQVDTGGFVMWDGTNESGAQVASGVYFREARMGGEVDVEKLALIK